MLILAFETSCDDTSIALFKDDVLISMDTASQISLHNITWWVVPEVAAREHANNIFLVLDNVLKSIKTKSESNLELFKKIDYIAVTTNPWLVPSLLTWISVASSISKSLDIPIIAINHIEAHIFSNFLERKESDIIFPLVCLTVSWWHNEIYHMKNMWDFNKIWSTNDDAAWEAFDKVAKMMGLSYPWWPIISKLSREYIEKTKDFPQTYNKLFPRVWLDKDKFDFSFSWLKSAVKREVDKRKDLNWDLSDDDKKEISYEFEIASVEVLADKLVNAWKFHWVKTIMLSWWVSANSRLKEIISKKAFENRLGFIYPIKNLYSMDNAWMVWINAFYKIKYKKYKKHIWVLDIA